jgi:hypothetical protein
MTLPRADRIRAAAWPVARFGLLAAAVMVAAHDLVYLAAYGLGAHRHALAASGHGGSWTAIVLTVLLAAGALGVLAVQRCRVLTRRLGDLGGVSVQPLSGAKLATRIGRLWLVVFAFTVALFLLQENLEHIVRHAGHVPGLGALYAGEYRAAIPILAVLSLAAATIGSLAIERLRALGEAVARAEQTTLRPRRQPLVRPASVLVRPRARRATPDLGRAPPLASLL